MHAEPSATIHLHRVLSRIRELGKQAGAVLDPATSIGLVEHVLHLCDLVLVMTVNPGFGGQEFLPEMLPKIRDLGRFCRERGVALRLAVDGGLDCGNAGQTIAAGADVIVAGSTIFQSQMRATAIRQLREGRPPAMEPGR